MTVMDFADTIMRHIQNQYAESMIYDLTTSDIASIEDLRDTKYSQWEWNFGYSPKYNYKRKSGLQGAVWR
jgi:lipoate---protein ligase